MHVLDAVLREIEAEIVAHPAERGGALLGPRGRPLVTHFLPDRSAGSTSSTWHPSRDLDRRVKEAEAAGALELKGLVHSHPRGVETPSEQDARELAVGLRVNPHLASYLAPIVTHGEPEELRPHQVALSGATISFFEAWRTPEGRADVVPAVVGVVPLRADLERAAAALGAGPPELLLARLGPAGVPAGRLALPDGGELLLVASEHYPALPPIALLTRGGATEQLELPWRVGGDPAERLASALRAVLGPGDALFARSGGLLAPALRERAVLVAGLGSVGSYVAEQLVRSGVGAVALVDPEVVEAANLSRAGYEARDVGAPKAEALARRLRAVNPSLRLDARACAVEALAPADLDALVRAAGLVVAATDDPAAQRALNRFAYARGRPALFVGLYAGAQGGEVVLSVPERTACYLCATRARHGLEASAGRVARDAEYGSGRLAAEPALGADVHHVASAAVKLGLALLAGEGPLRAWAEQVVEGGATYLTLSTVPGYWFYPQIFGDAPGQGAFQGVWLTPLRAADCPVCGDPGQRADPLAAPLRGPGRDAFAALRRDDGAHGASDPPRRRSP